MITKWPYSKERAEQYPSLLDEITSKQLWYVKKLSREHGDNDETLNNIMDSIDPNLDIEDMTKGQAMFVIKCLSGEIKPYEETKGVDEIIKDMWIGDL